MSDTNTNPVAASASVSGQGNKLVSGHSKGGKIGPTGRGASKQPSKSATLTGIHPRGQSRQHALNANSMSNYCPEWTAYGDLEPSGLPPWFAA